METGSKISEPNNKTFNLGFIGLGWIGRNRMERLLENPQVRCGAIVEPNKQNAEEAMALAEGIRLLSTSEQLISDTTIDGVVIATPSAMHAAQAVAALCAGKAVFCQKPLGRNYKEVEQVVKASAKNNKLLAVDLSYRYTEAFTAVHNIVKSGEMGKIYAVDLVFHNAYGPDKEWFYEMEKSGGGCLLDLGIHMLDLALWSLSFPKIENVQSHLYKNGRKLSKNENTVEDYATAMLLAVDGTAINLQCSWNISVGKEAVIEAKFFGTNGGVAFKNVNGSFYDFTAEKYNGTQTQTLVTPPDNWGGKAGLVWADAVTGGKGYNPVTAQEQLELAEIIDRIYGR